MKNDQQHQQSVSSLSHPMISQKFKLVFTFAATALAFTLVLYMKDYVSLSVDFVSSNLDAFHNLRRRHYTPPPPALHLTPKQVPIEHLEDEELLRRASTTQLGNNGSLALASDNNNVIPKVAFLFLSRQGLGLRLLWEKFFEGNEGLFSIYVHSNTSYNGTVPAESSVFHGRRITSKAVKWGEFSMVEAERRLLANALLDPSNKRFILLSETTIPLYNFTTIYNYLTNSSKTFVEVYDLPTAAGRGRYKYHMMSPTVTLKQWRKGSQWFEIDRDLALQVVTDHKYFPVFSKSCERRRCCADEHYLPTFVHILAPDRNSDRTVTWADWSMHGAHPSNFSGEQVTEGFLNLLRTGTKCEYNGEETNLCFLFARKFMSDALDELLRLAPRILGFIN
ncbi:hypothetical protein QQ045_022718 [Rhodiola kirilowii]